MTALVLNWRFGLVALFLVALATVMIFPPDKTGIDVSGRHQNNVAWIKGQAKTSSQLWTATRALTARENAERHFRKHNHDFHFPHVDAYIAAATTFLHARDADIQTKQQQDGDTVRFRASTGEFAVMRRDLTPRTYFILHPNIHGYQTNQAYFDAQ